MKRRNMLGELRVGVVSLALGLGVLATAGSLEAAAGKQETNGLFVYVGTYTYGKSEGIYVYRMDLNSGELKFASVTKGVVNPSFLAFGPRGHCLYSVCEVSQTEGKPGGAVSAFRIDRKTGKLTPLNQQPSGGAGPCHLCVDRKGNCVFVAHYGGGSVSVLPIGKDGRLGKLSHVVQHHGSSVNPRRQKSPHAHSTNLDPANRFLFVPDLGLDKIMIYRLDLAHGKLKPNDEPWFRVKAGAGPRHFTFHPNGRYAYVINELDCTLTAFAYDGERGRLTEIETASTLPEGFEGENTCADVHVLPSGKFVYGSNRGHDSIVIFAVDEATGKLAYVGHEPTQGKTPRNFAITPMGDFLLAANQNSNTIVVFRIDPRTGKLSPTGQVVEVPTPVCLKMMPASP